MQEKGLHKQKDEQRQPAKRGLQSIRAWVQLSDAELIPALNSESLADVLQQTKHRLSIRGNASIVLRGQINKIGRSFYHTIDFKHLVTTTEDGSQFTCGLDQSNFVNIRNYKPLMVMYTNQVEKNNVLSGADFRRAALLREVCWPRDVETLQAYHDYCLDKMGLRSVSKVRLDDWYGQG